MASRGGTLTHVVFSIKSIPHPVFPFSLTTTISRYPWGLFASLIVTRRRQREARIVAISLSSQLHVAAEPQTDLISVSFIFFSQPFHFDSFWLFITVSTLKSPATCCTPCPCPCRTKDRDPVNTCLLSSPPRAFWTPHSRVAQIPFSRFDKSLWFSPKLIFKSLLIAQINRQSYFRPRRSPRPLGSPLWLFPNHQEKPLWRRVRATAPIYLP